jgi:hypothetical protein
MRREDQQQQPGRHGAAGGRFAAPPDVERPTVQSSAEDERQPIARAERLRTEHLHDVCSVRWRGPAPSADPAFPDRRSGRGRRARDASRHRLRQPVRRNGDGDPQIHEARTRRRGHPGSAREGRARRSCRRSSATIVTAAAIGALGARRGSVPIAMPRNSIIPVDADRAASQSRRSPPAVELLDTR